MTIQTDEFYQLDLYQPNFEGLNGTWGGYFSGGRYGWEKPTGFEQGPSELITEVGPVPPRLVLTPVELITEVGPVPPRKWPSKDAVQADDGGITLALLSGALFAVALVRRFV